MIDSIAILVTGNPSFSLAWSAAGHPKDSLASPLCHSWVAVKYHFPEMGAGGLCLTPARRHPSPNGCGPMNKASEFLLHSSAGSWALEMTAQSSSD